MGKFLKRCMTICINNFGGSSVTYKNKSPMAIYTQLLIWLPLLLLLPLFLLMKKKIEINRQNRHLPPGPPKLPITGNLHQLGPLLHNSLWQLSKRYGPVMLLRLGAAPTLVVSSAEAAKEVLKTHDLDCCSRPPLKGTGRLSYNYLDIAFAPYGDYWRDIRKLCVLELFTTKRVQSFQVIREEEVALLIDSIARFSSHAKLSPIDLSEKLFSLAASVTFKVAFGKSFEGSGLDNDRFQEVVHEAQGKLGSFAASDFFPRVGWIIDRLTGLHGRIERSFHELDAFFQEVIDDHLNPQRMKQEKEDIIDVLLRVEKDQIVFGSVRLTNDHIKATLMDIFLAGVDTAAITMIWAMTELARNPRVMKKAQDEIRTCIGKKGKIAEGDIAQLQYLKMVVKETLRLHPPATLLLPRETMTHFKINGYDIYPKTRVQVNVWAIGRDPTIWEKPEEFFPERFMDCSIDFKGQHFEFLPFGSGRRVCPAINMGTSTVELALASLLYHFDWKLPDGMKEEDTNMEEAASLAIYKKVALKLVPINHQWPSKCDMS
ncbi:hypothetical protein L1049_006108 [Liquidambar formosana]|uniref:Cytochrome P450 n=1 Tax=Liquidambar formosana TaxID=63359 RepID=A0AAP0RGD6_LIQFO